MTSYQVFNGFHYIKQTVLVQSSDKPATCPKEKETNASSNLFFNKMSKTDIFCLIQN